MERLRRSAFLVGKLFSDNADNGNLYKYGIVGKCVPVRIADIANSRLNELKGLAINRKVSIRVPVEVKIYYDEDAQNEFTIGTVTQGDGCRTYEVDWQDYMNRLSAISSDILYFKTNGFDDKPVSITLTQPAVGLSQRKVKVVENITLKQKFDAIVLEPITNEWVTGFPGVQEVYNPSCIGVDSVGYFKVKVKANDLSGITVSWSAANGRVDIVTAVWRPAPEPGAYESVVTVKGRTVGEEELTVTIPGYDGIKPKVSLNVMPWKTVMVYACIVSFQSDSAFTDVEVDESFTYANQLYRQIAVSLVRRGLAPDAGKNPNQERYYRLPNWNAYEELLDIKTNTNDGIEVYFTAGYLMSLNWYGATRFNRGCVITKYGHIPSKVTNLQSLTPIYENYVFAHEVLHCMRKTPGIVNGSQVNDIYDNFDPELWSMKIKQSNVPLDYGNGYYVTNKTQAEIILNLLMFGEKSADGTLDIPRGSIWGVDKNNNKTHVNCGGVVDLQDRSFRNDDLQN